MYIQSLKGLILKFSEVFSSKLQSQFLKVGNLRFLSFIDKVLPKYPRNQY